MQTAIPLHSTRKRWVLTTITVAAVAAVVGGAIYGSRSATAAAPAAQAPAGVPVSVAAALQRRVTTWDEFSGRLEAIEQVEVRSRVSGYIEAVHFAPGSVVRKGATLFTIDARPFAAEVARAEASLAAAQARVALTESELARAKRLLEEQAIAQREFEERENAARDAQASLQSARAALEIARLNLGYTRITAPIDGRISRAEITAGNLVAAGAGGAALTTIVSLSPIHATFEVDEATYLRHAGRKAAGGGERLPVFMGLAHESGHPRQGRIDFVDNRLDPQSGTLRVRAVFDNRDGLLSPGLFTRLKLGGASEQEAVLVDDRAIGTDQSKRFVWVLGDKGLASYREVQLGPVVDGLRVIRSGLAAGETIVINGVQRVRPGVPLAPTVVGMDGKPAPKAAQAGPTPTVKPAA